MQNLVLTTTDHPVTGVGATAWVDLLGTTYMDPMRRACRMHNSSGQMVFLSDSTDRQRVELHEAP